MLTQDVSMRELKNSEARGMNNRTFSEIYEESEDNPKELEDGSFMFDNPQISAKKPDREYMDEVRAHVIFLEEEDKTTALLRLQIPPIYNI